MGEDKEQIYFKLNCVLFLKKPISELSEIIETIPFDIDDLIEINELHLLNVFLKYKFGVLTEDDLEIWANLLEVRDGFYFSSDKIKNLIYEIANPILVTKLDRHIFYNNLANIYLKEFLFNLLN